MLTDTQCRNAKPKDKPYKLLDSKGLYLEVKPNGVKPWRYRFELREGGTFKESLFAVGDYVLAPRGETPEEAQTRRGGGSFTLRRRYLGELQCGALQAHMAHRCLDPPLFARAHPFAIGRYLRLRGLILSIELRRIWTQSERFFLIPSWRLQRGAVPALAWKIRGPPSWP
jgi:hypothetical protein